MRPFEHPPHEHSVSGNPAARRTIFFWFYVGLAGVSLLGSLASHRLHLDASVPARLFGPTTLILGAFSLLDFVSWEDMSKAFRALGAAACAGTFIELIGTLTGFPFGRYHYTAAWFPTAVIGGKERFPILICFAWLLIAGGWSLALSRMKPKALGIVLAAVLAALTDLLMEPSAVHALGYWVWDDQGPLPGGAPVSNLIGWFFAALLVGLTVRWGLNADEKTDRPSRCAWIPVVHLIFMGGLYLISTM